MSEIILKVLDISTVLRPSNAHALVLKEDGPRERKLALIIGAHEAQCIKLARMDYQTPRPLTYEMMAHVLSGGGLHIEKAVIYDIREGIYSSWLHVERPDGSVFLVDSRTTDAICLSLLMHFPVCIDEELLERERLHGISDDGSCYTVSVNNVSLDMLKKAMDDAVRVEDYERASELRDEIRRREKGNVC
ncbi:MULTISPECIES: bifunctional nuclease family protein [Bacteroides]|uniref:Bifunctional nuclease family protein n=2 Tax=Bacteroidaceae TaxID=815 RepID=A0ABT7VDC2_9BACE|nr:MULTISPECIES: bifunctional nuclease family protein [Bacteroides]MBU3855384.1 bifunctional nuclease family protein [Candidatus Phocaeicola excrementipullorum]MBW9200903.1 hypothetical protein [Bacteroidales bacterium SW299]MCR8917633.1 bifunctional nuclease family protein [Bacteroides sp. ET225]MDM8207600.1 bifunctional nuclease family protein [Bacteroides gallinaceum]MDM8324282.1 bifunctional nuclease family protein [Bacteroides gallinaceum]